MFRPLEIYIGLRYLRPKRGGIFVSFVSFASAFGIALGVTALITILSVMNGFENELRSRLVSLTSHATVTAQQGSLDNWRAVADRARTYPEVTAATPYVEFQSMLATGPDLTPALLRGVAPDTEGAVSTISENMLYGSVADLRPGEGNIVLGKILALKLGVRPGDRVTVMVPTTDGAGIVPRLRRFTVSGVFEVGLQDHDGVLALVNLRDAADFGGLGDGVSGVRLALTDIFDAPVVVASLVDALGEEYSGSDWTVENASYFRAIKIEKTMMWFLLLTIVAVALFNIVATLVMVVSDKRNDIAILRTIGLKPAGVIGVFMTQGLILGWVGTLLGVGFGLLVAYNVDVIAPFLERVFGFHFFDPSVYYITAIPSDIQPRDVVLIASIALVLSLVATIYPARKAAATDPAVALRYE